MITMPTWSKFELRQVSVLFCVMRFGWIAVGRMGFRPSNAEWREMISVAVEAAMAEKDGGDLAQQARKFCLRVHIFRVWHAMFYLDACRLPCPCVGIESLD